MWRGAFLQGVHFLPLVIKQDMILKGLPRLMIVVISSDDKKNL